MTDLLLFLLSIIHQSVLWIGLSYIPYCLIPLDIDLWSASFVLIAPIAITTLAMWRFEQVWKIVLIHLACLVIPFLYSGEFVIRFFLILWSILLLISHVLDSRNDLNQTAMMKPTIGAIGVYPILYFVGWTTKAPEACTFASYAIVIDIFAYFLFLFLDNRQAFFTTFKDTADVPVAQINRVTKILLVILMGLMGVFMMFFGGSGIGNAFWQLLVWLGNRALDLLRWLLSGVKSEEVPAEQDASNSEMPAFDFGGDVTPTPVWLQMLEQILEYVLFAVSALILIAIICLILYRVLFKDKNAIAGSGTDESDHAGTEKAESTFKSRRTSGDHLSVFDFSESGRVRRAYYRAIRAARKKDQELSSAYTPEELEQSVALEDSVLHRAYEKARYSASGADRSDLDAIKKNHS